MIRTNRSIHVYLNEDEYEQVDRVIEKLRLVGSGNNKLNKGDAAAALLMVAMGDTALLAKVRKYLTLGE